MKEPYDFTKAERGKFYRPNAKLNIPVYPDDEVRDFVVTITEQKRSGLDRAVNDSLRLDTGLAKVMQ